jgi:CHAD domain-containing protein
VRACLRRWRRKARREARAWATLDDEARHALRKRLKRLRYLIEGALPVLPRRRARAELAALRGLQEALGRWNDLVVARAMLGPPADAGAAFLAGWLAAETAAADRACAAAAAAWLAGRDGLRARQLRG